MTIQSLQENIHEFKEIIVTSGFLRDITSYLTAIAQPQNQVNLLLLKETNEKTIAVLEHIYSMYSEHFKILFPTLEVKSFTETDYVSQLVLLQKNTEIPVAQFFTQLHSILTLLKNSITANITELNKLEEQLAPFLKNKEQKLKEENRAILSIDFKNKDTIGSLKKFSETLNNWNRSLFIYHQLLSSRPPKDISLIDVENGSIDIIINIDLEIAKNLLELFSAGLTAFTTYLLWKVQRDTMAKSYNGNEKLLELDKQYETELIKNVTEAVRNELINQHEGKIKIDANIDKSGLDVKYLEVSSLIQEHIVKGNDIRLLNQNVENKDLEHVEKETKKLSIKAQKELKKLPKAELIKMIEEFIPREQPAQNESKKTNNKK